MRRWLALLAALCLMIPAALAEDTPLDQLLPLLDQAAQQIVAEEAQGRYCGVRPMAADESDAGDAMRILGDVYLADGQLDTLTDEQYAQVEWLDRRAVVELRRDDAGWRLASISLDAEWEMEALAQEYFADTMVEYVNTALGFSIQYPAVFGEESVTVADNGVSGEIEGASFEVVCLPNDQAWTTEAFLSSQKQEPSAGETNIDIHTGLGSFTATVEGQRVLFMAVATQEYVYQAVLRYDESLLRDFLHISEYMMNSFTVDEMGNG